MLKEHVTNNINKFLWFYLNGQHKIHHINFDIYRIEKVKVESKLNHQEQTYLSAVTSFLCFAYTFTTKNFSYSFRDSVSFLYIKK